MKARARRRLRAQLGGAVCERCRAKALTADADGVICLSCGWECTPEHATTLRGFHAGARPYRFKAGYE